MDIHFRSRTVEPRFGAPLLTSFLFSFLGLNHFAWKDNGKPLLYNYLRDVLARMGFYPYKVKGCNLRNDRKNWGCYLDGLW